LGKIAGGGACATEGKGEIATSRLALLAMTGLRAPRENCGLGIEWKRLDARCERQIREQEPKLFNVVGAVSDRDLL